MVDKSIFTEQHRNKEFKTLQEIFIFNFSISLVWYSTSIKMYLVKQIHKIYIFGKAIKMYLVKGIDKKYI